MQRSQGHIDDVTQLEQLTEQTLLNHIKERYSEDNIYTSIGPILLSVNPFQKIARFGPQIISQYPIAQRGSPSSPHPYAIARRAYQNLIDESRSQSIIISGESGSGKTEATKIVLQYLTVVASQNELLAKMIQATNPLLEVFGNAMTVANQNSSRFGKFIKIVFQDSQIVGAKLSTYLLEKTRVVHQGPNERNYHIFYALLQGSTPHEKKKYCLLHDTNQYRYLVNGEMECIVDTTLTFQIVKKALAVFSFDPPTIDSVFKILSGILLLGNLQFSNSDQVSVLDEEDLQTICHLFGNCSFLALKNSLERRNFSAGGRGSSVRVPLKYHEAMENRDALAKAIYARLFDWLIEKLNERLISDDRLSDSQKFIGVLDIYGFEVFKTNSLEQLTINYANERLHQRFNDHMFAAEQEEYLKEGLSWEKIGYIDNAHVVNLIDNRGGIFATMNDEARSPGGGTDKNLAVGISSIASNPAFVADRLQKHFKIKHYAGPVDYVIEGLLDKNKDTLLGETIEAILTTDDPHIIRIFEVGYEPGMGHGPSAAKASGNKLTVTQKFKLDLSSLMQTLSQTSSHYILCITPNINQSPSLFQDNKFLGQMRCLGIESTVKLRKSGYSSRMEFESWVDKYGILLDRCRSIGIPQIQTFLQRDLPRGSFAIGKTKVFLRDDGVGLLDKKKARFEYSAIVLQKNLRAFRCRFLYNSFLQKKKDLSVVVLQKNIRRWKVQKAYFGILEEQKRRLVMKTVKIQSFVRGYNEREVRRLLERYREERNFKIRSNEGRVMNSQVSRKELPSIPQIQRTMSGRRGGTLPATGVGRPGTPRDQNGPTVAAAAPAVPMSMSPRTTAPTTPRQTGSLAPRTTASSSPRGEPQHQRGEAPPQRKPFPPNGTPQTTTPRGPFNENLQNSTFAMSPFASPRRNWNEPVMSAQNMEQSDLDGQDDLLRDLNRVSISSISYPNPFNTKSTGNIRISLSSARQSRIEPPNYDDPDHEEDSGSPRDGRNIKTLPLPPSKLATDNEYINFGGPPLDLLVQQSQKKKKPVFRFACLGGTTGS